MNKLPLISSKECINGLGESRILPQETREQPCDPEARRSLCSGSCSDHKEIDRGTLRAIIRQAGLSVAEFLKLL